MSRATGAPTSLTMAGNRIWTALRPTTTSGQTAIRSRYRLALMSALPHADRNTTVRFGR